MESAIEELGHSKIFELRVLYFCHFLFNVICLFELAFFEEVCTFLQLCHHIIVIKSKLKISHRILCGRIFVSVIVTDPFLNFLDHVLLKFHHYVFLSVSVVFDCFLEGIPLLSADLTLD